MSDLATLLAQVPRVLVGRVPMRNTGIVIGDPYFVTVEDAVELPLSGRDPAWRPPVFVLRAAVKGWGRRNLAARLRFEEGPQVGRLEPLEGPFGQHVFQSDTGLGAYMDVVSLQAFHTHQEVFRLAHPDRIYHAEILAPLLRQSAERPEDEWDAGSRALFDVPSAEDAGIAVFQCGLGGGGFSTWLEWQRDRLVGIVTDFHVLAHAGVMLEELDLGGAG